MVLFREKRKAADSFNRGSMVAQANKRPVRHVERRGKSIEIISNPTIQEKEDFFTDEPRVRPYTFPVDPPIRPKTS